MSPPPGRTQVLGEAAIAAALAAGELGVLLVAAGAEEEHAEVVAEARRRGVPVWVGSEGDLRRMSPDSHAPESLIGMRGAPPVTELPDLLARGGAVWLLAGVSYPSNVGFVLRTAEVSGASGVVVDGDFNHGQRSRAAHVAMGAARLLPLCYASAMSCVTAARDAGFSIVALEASGNAAPWEVDLRGDVLLVVGGERFGVTRPLLDICDVVARLPMRGFVPSYSLQAAVSAVALERLRQLDS